MFSLRREYFEDGSKLISKCQAVWKRLILNTTQITKGKDGGGGGGDMRPHMGKGYGKTLRTLKPFLQRKKIGTSNYCKHS